jgi:hypothetical protein
LASTSDDATDREKERQDKNDRGRGNDPRGDDGENDDGEHDDGEHDDEDDDGDRNGRGRSLSGFVTAVSTDSITIRGVVVKVTPTTVIHHGNRRLTLAQIAVGDHAQAKGAMSPDGTTFTAI